MERIGGFARLFDDQSPDEVLAMKIFVRLKLLSRGFGRVAGAKEIASA